MRASLNMNFVDLEIDQPGAALYELRDGKILWAASYLSQADALKAAGVSE